MILEAGFCCQETKAQIPIFKGGTKAMKSKVLINARKKRKIPKHFSWVDHRLIRENYLQQCSTDALALYLFLITAGDHEGLSYYGEKSIKKYLNFNSSSNVASCRKELTKAGLIVYLKGLYQVLGLESDDISTCCFRKAVNHSMTAECSNSSDSTGTESVGDVIDKICGGI